MSAHLNTIAIHCHHITSHHRIPPHIASHRIASHAIPSHLICHAMPCHATCATLCPSPLCSNVHLWDDSIHIDRHLPGNLPVFDPTSHHPHTTILDPSPASYTRNIQIAARLVSITCSGRITHSQHQDACVSVTCSSSSSSSSSTSYTACQTRKSLSIM